MTCVECGAQTAGPQFCSWCGAPVSGQPSSAEQKAGGPEEHPEMAPGPAADARPWPAPIRWFFAIGLAFCLILLAIGQVGVVHTPRTATTHDNMVGISWLGILGTILFLVLFECARKQFANAQAGWACVALFSAGLLAPVPFLWLALVRRRVMDWFVFAIYVAATITVIAALSSVPSTTSITGYPVAIWMMLLVISPVHAVLAFNRAAKVPTWRQAYPGGAPFMRRRRINDAVLAADRPSDDNLGSF